MADDPSAPETTDIDNQQAAASGSSDPAPASGDAAVSVEVDCGAIGHPQEGTSDDADVDAAGDASVAGGGDGRNVTAPVEVACSVIDQSEEVANGGVDTDVADDANVVDYNSIANVMLDVFVEESDGIGNIGSSSTPPTAAKASHRGSDARSSLGGPLGTSSVLVRSNDFKTMSSIAKANARLNRLAGGSKTAFNAKMSDIGALGIGLQLYFMLTKYLSVTFGIMGILALPAIVLNKYGHGITSKMVDPLQLAYASLGNQGVNSQIANNTLLCLPTGSIDCTWTTVTTPLTSDPYRVTWILTFSDCAYSLFFALFCVFYWRRVRLAIDLHLTENLTPAKYAVFVRGLPSDATEEEILKHFNALYDPTTRDQYFPLWFGCCWGRRQKVKHSRLPVSMNNSVVANLDHLKGTKRSKDERKKYLNTWIAEVSVAHPTGGMLRAFLSMEALTQSISETRTLISTLSKEKRASPATFKVADEKLIHSSMKKLDKLLKRLEKAKRSIKQLRDVLPEKKVAKAEATQARLEKKMRLSETGRSTALKRGASSAQRTREKMAAAAAKAKKAATKTQRAFNWDACECAFVVFNNLESRRRCLRDYRYSNHWLARRFQPELLRFRDGEHALTVVPAPEPSNILWENLEVTDRGRLYRQSFTNLLTFVLLLASAIVISAAQSAQQDFQSKLPPTGLCETSLPQVFYGNSSYTSNRKLKWELEWDQNADCAAGEDGRPLYHIAYSNGIVNDLTFAPSYGPSNPSPVRCVDPCVSETSDRVCSTLPCFNYQALVIEGGQACETYLASHMLYCYCSAALTTSIQEHGYVNGARSLWDDYEPCRAFIKDYSLKNVYIVVAAAVVVVVNLLLKMLIRAFATFERHTSESAKMLAIALKTFGAQLLNTAIIVLLVNTSLGLTSVPVVKALFKGKYHDFEREWYPSVGMGITTTMLINAVMPQLSLLAHMFVAAPLARVLSRRSIRTQQRMDKLYAGPDFDMSVRYPMVLNSVFVTMMFAGGSPILLFIAALTSAATYWLDKLSLLHLYSVRTTYDEALGEVALSALPWTLAIHFGFSAWMYGNTDLMKANLVDLRWVMKTVGLSSLLDSHPDASNSDLYALLMEKAATFDALGKYGLIVKLVRSHVMLMSILFAATVVSILLSTLLLPVVVAVAAVAVKAADRAARCVLAGISHVFSAAAVCLSKPKPKRKRKLVVVPEFTDLFRKSVQRNFRPDRALGFHCRELDEPDESAHVETPKMELVCVWREDTAASSTQHQAGERKRTWEAMQAPVKSYSIEMNSKYTLAVKEVEAAWEAIKQREAALRGKVSPVLGDKATEEQVAAVESLVAASITATEPVSRVEAERDGAEQDPWPVTSFAFDAASSGHVDAGEDGVAVVKSSAEPQSSD